MGESHAMLSYGKAPRRRRVGLWIRVLLVLCLGVAGWLVARSNTAARLHDRWTLLRLQAECERYESTDREIVYADQLPPQQRSDRLHLFDTYEGRTWWGRKTKVWREYFFRVPPLFGDVGGRANFFLHRVKLSDGKERLVAVDGFWTNKDRFSLIVTVVQPGGWRTDPQMLSYTELWVKVSGEPIVWYAGKKDPDRPCVIRFKYSQGSKVGEAVVRIGDDDVPRLEGPAATQISR